MVLTYLNSLLRFTEVKGSKIYIIFFLCSFSSFAQKISKKDIIYQFPQKTNEIIKKLRGLQSYEKSDTSTTSEWDVPTFMFFYKPHKDTIEIFISYIPQEILKINSLKKYIYFTTKLKNANRFLKIDNEKIPILGEKDFSFFCSNPRWFNHENLIAMRTIYIKKSDGSFIKKEY